MTALITTWLRRITSPRPSPSGPSGRRAAALLLRLACVALLAWIGYIHLHLWLEGYRQIPTDGPLFLLDALAAFLLAAATSHPVGQPTRHRPAVHQSSQAR